MCRARNPGHIVTAVSGVRIPLWPFYFRARQIADYGLSSSIFGFDSRRVHLTPSVNPIVYKSTPIGVLFTTFYYLLLQSMCFCGNFHTFSPFGLGNLNNRRVALPVQFHLEPPF